MLLAVVLRPAGAADPPFPRDIVQAVLASAFDVLLDRHLEAAAPGQIGLWALSGLAALDPTLRPELRAGTLLLLEDERLLGARPVPPPGAAARGAGALATAVAAQLDAAWRASPPLREAGSGRVLQAAFEGISVHLDPYSRYLTPAEAAAARLRRVGQSALGLLLGPGPRGSVAIASVTPGATADRVGLRAGDRVLAIDGEPVAARRLPLAVELLEGPTGSAALLSVQRGARRLDIVLPREVVPPDTVRAERRDGILWIRIDGFANDTDNRLAQALERGIEPGTTLGIVLDLRGNRGGLLSQAVGVAGTFLTGGVVVRTAGRHADAERTYQTDDEDHAAGLPVVVLVDARTASAAEIVAAALADRGRAVVVGSATTGKGLVQVVAPLANGGEWHVSWARVLSPSGWPVQELGVLPAVCTSLDEAATATALAAIRQGLAPPAPAVQRARALNGTPTATEIAALRATCAPAAPREGEAPPPPARDTDALMARALLENPAAYAALLAR